MIIDLEESVMFGFVKLPKTSHTVGFAFKCATPKVRKRFGCVFNY